MALRSLRICASVGGWAMSSGCARNGEYETLFSTPSTLGAEACVCHIAQAKACRHATSATTDTTERIALYRVGREVEERRLSPRHRRGRCRSAQFSRLRLNFKYNSGMAN